MAPTITAETLGSVLDEFARKVEQVRNTPGDVDNAFDTAVASAYGEEFGDPASPGFVFDAGLALASSDLATYLRHHQAEVKEGIRQLLENLHGAIESMRAPVAFVETGELWLSLRSTIQGAQNFEVIQAGLNSWQGLAAEKYAGTRQAQNAALASVEGLCSILHDCMYAIATAAWDFYSAVVEKLASFLVKLASALAKIESLVAAYQGASDAIAAAKAAANDMGELSLKLGSVLMKEEDGTGVIDSAIDNPVGMLGNKWPPAGAGGKFDVNSAGEGWQPR
ncbi:hypothetical protein [Nocardia sp. alder85J]|uniref:hypothetical protein n=1 Tax=Nocardia sp. alder85J TaxID=2862949 RepID=UPI001CD21200|nr:hypothetical protein [Nocardia sp. alder85J]MCX4092073.1 hypothetical protein [Nocardia sp. alder85J]